MEQFGPPAIQTPVSPCGFEPLDWAARRAAEELWRALRKSLSRKNGEDIIVGEIQRLGLGDSRNVKIRNRERIK
jgi:hypothetical protein